MTEKLTGAEFQEEFKKMGHTACSAARLVFSKTRTVNDWTTAKNRDKPIPDAPAELWRLYVASRGGVTW